MTTSKDATPDAGQLDNLDALADGAAEPHLQGLGEQFMAALEVVRKGKVDEAAEALRAILRVEPRLAEPRIELARLHLELAQPDEAAEQAEEAVEILRSGGQWIEDLSEEAVLSIAWDLRGEALRRMADKDEVVFGDPDEWRRLIEQSAAAFKEAARLDPDNAHARYWSGSTDAEIYEQTIGAADMNEGDEE